jgi:hypothetical protein
MGGKENWACANREAKKAGIHEWPPTWSDAPYNVNFLCGFNFGMSMIFCRIKAGIDTPYTAKNLWACANQAQRERGASERPEPASWESVISQYHPKMNAGARKLAKDFRTLLRKGHGYVNEDEDSRVVCWKPFYSPSEGRMVCADLVTHSPPASRESPGPIGLLPGVIALAPACVATTVAWDGRITRKIRTGAAPDLRISSEKGETPRFEGPCCHPRLEAC